MGKILVIGYGNTMRSDDAVGVHAAHTLEEAFRDEPGVRVIAAHQLTPELVEEIAEARFVLFLDAAARNRPGEILESLVAPKGGQSSLAHRVTPPALLMAGEELHGEAPPAISLTMAGESFEVGPRLSAAIERRMEEFTARASEIVRMWLRQKTMEKPVRTK